MMKIMRYIALDTFLIVQSLPQKILEKEIFARIRCMLLEGQQLYLVDLKFLF